MAVKTKAKNCLCINIKNIYGNQNQNLYEGLVEQNPEADLGSIFRGEGVGGQHEKACDVLSQIKMIQWWF